MGTIVDRDGMVELLAEEFEAIVELCATFDRSQWIAATDLPGWSVKDTLAHLVGTESMLAGDPAPVVDVGHYGHLPNEIARTNQAWVESMRSLGGPAILDRFRSVVARRLDALGRMTQQDFDRPSSTPVGPDESYGRFMRIRHYDCFLHEHDMRGAARVTDRNDRKHLVAALAEPESALGYIVGRRAGLPTGTSAVIRLTEPAERTWSVQVNERALLVDELDGPPTASISLPPMLFLRLSAGRDDPRGHIGGDLLLGGDLELATRLAVNLSFTI